MKLYNICLVLLIVAGSFKATAQLNSGKHKIAYGETVYGIARKYNTTPKAIFDLNPKARKGIQAGAYIVLPENAIANTSSTTVNEGISFKQHKVRSTRQTLYDVARKYGVSIDEITKHNSFLKKEPLKKGDVLNIPQPAKIK